MKLIPITLLALLSSVLCTVSGEEPENILRNGDFEKGGGWKGDGRIVQDSTSEQNKVYVVALGSKEKEFSQSVNIDRKTSKVTVKFRARPSKDYKPKNSAIAGLVVRSRGAKIGLISECSFEDLGQWRGYSFSYECAGAKEVTIQVQVRPGEGSVEFDDFVMTEH